VCPCGRGQVVWGANLERAGPGKKCISASFQVMTVGVKILIVLNLVNINKLIYNNWNFNIKK
jgi:hypothetical protein